MVDLTLKSRYQEALYKCNKMINDTDDKVELAALYAAKMVIEDGLKEIEECSYSGWQKAIHHIKDAHCANCDQGDPDYCDSSFEGSKCPYRWSLEALALQVPTAYLYSNHRHMCPNCFQYIDHNVAICPECGQHIDNEV